MRKDEEDPAAPRVRPCARDRAGGARAEGTLSSPEPPALSWLRSLRPPWRVRLFCCQKAAQMFGAGTGRAARRGRAPCWAPAPRASGRDRGRRGTQGTGLPRRPPPTEHGGGACSELSGAHHVCAQDTSDIQACVCSIHACAPTCSQRKPSIYPAVFPAALPARPGARCWRGPEMHRRLLGQGRP